MYLLSDLSTSIILVTALVNLFPSAHAASYKMKGCWKNVSDLTSKGTYKWQSAGNCAQECSEYAIMAMTSGNECLCTNILPLEKDRTNDDDCSTPCVGYPSDLCGSDDYYSIYLTGNKKPETASEDKTAATSATRGQGTSVATKSTSVPSMTTSPIRPTSDGQTVPTTDSTSPAGATETATKGNKSGGTNKAAIAAGVVVGVVGTAAVIAGAIFWTKRRNRAKVEEEYRRNAQLSDYVAGGAASGAARDGAGREKYGRDQRLDPSAQRRLSNGSIADVQDYSRRILKVGHNSSPSLSLFTQFPNKGAV
ncbi:hypothetical protein KEM54_004344 [Ascosphaera aggregata]|nr:hypothetical protein KEM54_004344 [Ascosphaera aggregata]